MEFANEFGRVRDIRSWFPSLGFSGIFVAEPPNKILELVSTKSGVEYGGNLIFGLSIDFDSRWRWLKSIRKFIGSVNRKK
jgi:hypothetical protein